MRSLPKAPSLPSWGAYWTVITGITVLAFLVYLAGRGLLSQWLALFAYSAPATAGGDASSAPNPSGAAAVDKLEKGGAAAIPGVLKDFGATQIAPYVVPLPFQKFMQWWSGK